MQFVSLQSKRLTGKACFWTHVWGVWGGAHPLLSQKKMTKPKTKRASPRPNECGFSQAKLQKMSKKKRTKVYTRGTVMGLCRNCQQTWRPVAKFFLPNTRSEVTARRVKLLQDACGALKKLYEEGTKQPDDPKWAKKRDKLVATIVDKRSSKCIECGKAASGLSPAQKECKQFWEFLKWVHCKKNNGCANTECTERGMSSWPCISADHTDPSTKVHRLSDYKWWAWNGGVDAMLAESKKCTWPCWACHTLRPTSAAGKERTTQTLPCYIACDARVKAKEDFNNALKMERSKTCEYDGCPYPVTKATVRSLDWSHRDATQKATHDTHSHLVKKSCKGGGVAAMVHSCTIGAALHAKVPGDTTGRTNADVLKAETELCDLHCTNCHHSRRGHSVDASTNPVRNRWDDAPPQNNPWVQSALKQRSPGVVDKVEVQRRAILKFDGPWQLRK